MIAAATHPIVVKRKPLPNPVVPIARWQLVGKPGVLTKTYSFKERSERDDFVVAVLGQEATSGAESTLILHGLTVTITIVTAGLNVVTNSDREHARMCDVLFKELAYHRSDEADGEDYS